MRFLRDFYKQKICYKKLPGTSIQVGFFYMPHCMLYLLYSVLSTYIVIHNLTTKTLLEIYIKGRGRTGKGRNASPFPFPFPFTSFDFLPHILKALIKFTPGQVGQLIMYYTP